MASCCWSADWQFLHGGSPLRFWARDTQGWVDMWQEGDTDKIFSGAPQWVKQSADGVVAWNEINTAVAQHIGYIHRPGNYSHFGESQIPRCFRTIEWKRQGGAIPVAFFNVPGYYLDHVTPGHENRFSPSSALNFNRGAGGDLHRQLRNHGYIEGWENWKNITPGNGVPRSERPPSFSDEQIQIAVKWIWFDDITFPGGSWHTTTHWISNHGGLLRTDIRVDWRRKSPDFSGFSVPIVFLKQGKYVIEAARTKVYVGPLEVIGDVRQTTNVQFGEMQILDADGEPTGETVADSAGEFVQRVFTIPNNVANPRGAIEDVASNFLDASYARNEQVDSYVRLAKNARAVNSDLYTNMSDMINQLNPYDEDDLEPLRMYVNGKEVDVADGRVYDNLRWLPVQEWSAPNNFANGGVDSGSAALQ